MTLNITRSIFLDEQFRPRPQADLQAFEQVLKLCRDAGYRAVDLTDRESVCFGAEGVGRLLEQYGLVCASVILFEQYTCPEGPLRERVMDHTYKALDDAAAIGCRTVMLVSAGVYPGMSRREHLQALGETLSLAADYGKRLGVTVCVEDFPSTQIPLCAIEDMDALFDRAKGLGLVYDTANMLAVGEDPRGYYEHFKDRICYCHLKDVRLEAASAPVGDTIHDGRKMITTRHGHGIIDLEAVIGWLAADGYDGYLSVEYAPDGETESLLSVLADERSYLEAFIRRH